MDFNASGLDSHPKASIRPSGKALEERLPRRIRPQALNCQGGHEVEARQVPKAKEIAFLLYIMVGRVCALGLARDFMSFPQDTDEPST